MGPMSLIGLIRYPSPAFSETSPVQFLLQERTILDPTFREQFLSSNPNPFSFVQRT
jgi:hypothetical protein